MGSPSHTCIVTKFPCVNKQISTFRSAQKHAGPSSICVSNKYLRASGGTMFPKHACVGKHHVKQTK